MDSRQRSGIEKTSLSILSAVLEFGVLLGHLVVSKSPYSYEVWNKSRKTRSQIIQTRLCTPPFSRINLQPWHIRRLWKINSTKLQISKIINVKTIMTAANGRKTAKTRHELASLRPTYQPPLTQCNRQLPQQLQKMLTIQ